MKNSIFEGHWGYFTKFNMKTESPGVCTETAKLK
jgi:hypothetical protein